MTVSITAVIQARNENHYLKYLVPYLASENIEIVLIDNGSIDGTQDIYNKNNYPNIVERIDLTFNGTFDLSEQLQTKSTIFQHLNSDWLIHQDADEILQSSDTWGNLRCSIESANQQGFIVLNFDELVMLPADPSIDDHMNNNLNYYFFEPAPRRLMRVWKRSANLSNLANGGHKLEGGDISFFPNRMLLKHFIVRSQKHAYDKYLGRTYANHDTSKGWHGNRIGLTKEMLKIPTDSLLLNKLTTPQDTPLVLPKSLKHHYWHW
jgi:glycosyltransferase involved in cell wall biosynthesis